jgi:hypothetical protein
MGFQHKTYKPCGARCKRTGEPCQNPIVKGSTRCRMHGGKTPTGPKSHQFSHGYYSKDSATKTLWRFIQRNYRLMLADERSERWLAEHPRPRIENHKSFNAYYRASKSWFAAYSLFMRFARNDKTDMITASEAQAAYDEYCDLVGSREFWDVYLLAVYGIRLPKSPHYADE